MPNMPATGVSGVDLYTYDRNGKEIYLAGKYQFKDTITFTYAPIYIEKKPKIHRCTLYLPLYNEVQWLEVGVDDGADFHFEPVLQSMPIVAYGTSICQGASASRPAMAWTNILHRRLGHEVVNLGFSGAAKLESEMVAFVAEPEADLYVVDAALNNVAPVLEQNLGPFVRSLAAKRPDKPILVCEPANTFEKETDRSLATRKVFEELKADGLNVYLIRTDELMIPDSEGTVDGCHPNAYGAIQMGRAFAAKIREILK